MSSKMPMQAVRVRQAEEFVKGRAEREEQNSRQETDDQREQQLDRQRHREFDGTFATTLTQVVGLAAEDLGHARTDLFGLHESR